MANRSKFDTWEKRRKLATEDRHQEPLSPGRYLVYRRPKSGSAGSWSAYWCDLETHKKRMNGLGAADDTQDANGAGILTYAQAKAKAEEWFQQQTAGAYLEATGETLRTGPYTVTDAMQDYLQDAERRGVKGIKIMTLTSNAHILPALDEFEVAKLTKPKIEGWLHSLAEAARRKTGRPRAESEEVKHLDDPATEDEKRARKDTANRILTNLKSALNLARKNGLVTCPPVWNDAARFKNVGSARVRFLTVQEQRLLVNACPPGFRELVQAALYTGCRCGELCRLAVRDFDATRPRASSSRPARAASPATSHSLRRARSGSRPRLPVSSQGPRC